MGPLLKAVSFDLWGTLFSLEREAGKDLIRCRSLLAVLNDAGLRGLSEEVLLNAHRQVEAAGTRRRRTQGRDLIPEEQLFRLLEQLRLDVDRLVFDRLLEAYCTVSLAIPPEPVPEAREVLAGLSRTYDLTLICNTGATPGWVLRPLLDQACLLPYLKSPLFSNEVGFAKPHPRIYRRALEGLGGLQPAEVVHVGDDPLYDIIGPREFGMKTVWIDHGTAQDQPPADAVVFQLGDVPAAIDRLARARSATA